MFEILHEPEDPVRSPEEVRIEKAAELGDELVRLEKTSTRARVMRLVFPGLSTLVMVAYALEVGDPFIVSILIGALVGIVALQRWWASVLTRKRLLVEEEFDALTREFPASQSSEGQNPQEPGV